MASNNSCSQIKFCFNKNVLLKTEQYNIFTINIDKILYSTKSSSEDIATYLSILSHVLVTVEHIRSYIDAMYSLDKYNASTKAHIFCVLDLQRF